MWDKHLIETERGEFEVFTAGQGDPLCVTHLYSEFNANGNFFASKFTPYYKVYLVNLRGCGQSTDDTSIYNYNLQDSVADLEAIRKAFDIKDWGFAGHSTGGMLALKYAIQAPSNLNFIVGGGLCPSSDYMRNEKSIYCKKNPNNQRIGEIIAVLRNPESTLEERRAVSKEWALMSLCKAESYDEMLKRPNSGKTVSKRLDYFSYEELPTFDLRPQLPNVQTKAFIYGGVHDAQCPYEYAVETANLLPNCTLTTFHESNHNPMIEEEQKFEQFVEMIANSATAH